MPRLWKRQLGVWLGAVTLMACAPQDNPRNHDSASQDASSGVRITLEAPPETTARNSERYQGTFSDVEVVLLQVKESSTNSLSDNITLTRTNNVWSGVLDNVSLNVAYNFTAEAHDNSSSAVFGDNDTILFRGQSTQTLTTGDETLRIRMEPYADPEDLAVAIPRITRIYYTPDVFGGEEQEIVVEVQASLNDNLSYAFSTTDGGTFLTSPSGSYVTEAEYTSFSADFQAPSSGTTQVAVRVSNQLNYAMTSTVFISADNTTEIQPSVLFNPVVLAFQAERTSGDNVTFTAVVTDDGQLSNLRDNWSYTPNKSFAVNPPVVNGDNATFSAVMSGYSASENGTLSLNLTSEDGDNITVNWPIEVNAFPNIQLFSPISEGLTTVATGAAHSCRVTEMASVECWGDNSHGQLGNGSLADNSTPQPVGTLSTVKSVAAGDNSTCALLANGSVSCWGQHYATSPTPIVGTSDVTQISVGLNSYACGLLDNGSVSCWDNSTGVLITATTVVSSNTARQVSVGGDYQCALLDNASIDCWTTGIEPVVPAAIQGQAVHVAAGLNHACAVIDNGSVGCWGENASGQLGNAPLMDLNANYVSAGDGFSCAVVDSGKLKCWGANANGQLGGNTLEGAANNPNPAAVYGGINNAAQVSTGGGHACVMLKDNSSKCWGLGDSGQLGNGAFDNRTFPVNVFNY